VENLVKVKAALISEKSQATLELSYNTAEVLSWQLEGGAMLACDKSQKACDLLEARLVNCGAMDYVQKIESCLQGGSELVVSKANAVSKVAKSAVRLPVCMKTGGLPSPQHAMRKSLESVMRKGRAHTWHGAGASESQPPVAA